MSNFWKSFLFVLACVFLCVASFFTGYFFRDTVRIKQSETINSLCAVKPADAVSDTYSFQGSNFPVLLSFYNNNSSLDYDADPFGACVNSSVGFSEYIPVTFLLNDTYAENNKRFIGWKWALPGISNFNYVRLFLEGFDYGIYNYDSWNYCSEYIGYPFNHYMFFAFNISSNFNYNVVRVVIDSGYNAGGKGLYTTRFSFYDVNGYSCKFELVLDKNIDDVNNYMLTSRTYYFINNFTDNDYYNQGYQTGFNNGVNSGKQTGYNNGYNVGYSDGKSDGYDEGVNSITQYSFANLLTAVVEAPVNVFISLLDFNIMGYNLLSLVVGLLSLAVIVVIIKLCLGGK